MHEAGEEYRKEHAAIRTSLTKPQEARGATLGKLLA